MSLVLTAVSRNPVGLLSLASLSLALIASGCASQKAAARDSQGISLSVAPEAVCSNLTPTEKAPLPDGQLCKDVVATLKSELERTGFTVVNQETRPDALSLKVFARQSVAAGAPAQLAIELRALKDGQEIEVFSRSGDLSAKQASDEITSVVRGLTEELAGSPLIRSSGS